MTTIEKMMRGRSRWLGLALVLACGCGQQLVAPTASRANIDVTQPLWQLSTMDASGYTRASDWYVGPGADLNCTVSVDGLISCSGTIVVGGGAQFTAPDGTVGPMTGAVYASVVGIDPEAELSTQPPVSYQGTISVGDQTISASDHSVDGILAGFGANAWLAMDDASVPPTASRVRGSSPLFVAAACTEQFADFKEKLGKYYATLGLGGLIGIFEGGGGIGTILVNFVDIPAVQRAKKAWHDCCAMNPKAAGCEYYKPPKK